MPLNNLGKTTQVISKVNTPSEEVEKLKKRIKTLNTKVKKQETTIEQINMNLRIKEEQLDKATQPTKEHTELNLIKRAIIDKVKAFERNIKAYCKKHTLTEEDLSKMSIFKQPKNYIEKKEYLKILEGMK